MGGLGYHKRSVGVEGVRGTLWEFKDSGFMVLGFTVWG